MLLHRAIAISALGAALSACASHSGSTSVAAAPKAGPKASVYATFRGGMINRETSARFRTDEDAYVLVGHLGGDGRVEVLYPETARHQRQVRGKVTYRIPAFLAPYDAAPSLYRFAATPLRTSTARFDSYDGLGYGFIFIVASKTPFHVDAYSDHGEWDPLELDDYYAAFDPRESIRVFAEALSGGEPYTLSFARSYQSIAMNNPYDARLDCAVMSSMNLGFQLYHSLAYGWASPYSYVTSRNALPGCYNGYRSYASAYNYWFLHRSPDARGGDGIPTRVPTVTVAKPTSTASYTPDPNGRAIDRERRRPQWADDDDSRPGPVDRARPSGDNGIAPLRGIDRSDPPVSRTAPEPRSEPTRQAEPRPVAPQTPREVRTELTRPTVKPDQP
jgi:hypothetical protein